MWNIYLVSSIKKATVQGWLKCNGLLYYGKGNFLKDSQIILIPLPLMIVFDRIKIRAL